MSAPGFRRPAAGWFVVLDGGIGALCVLAADPAPVRALRDRLPLPSRRSAAALLGATALIHLGEAAYAGRAARRAGLPAGRWARQTFAVGFPSLLALSRTVREGAGPG